MNPPRLPGGGNAWFVRHCSRWRCQMTPVSPAGWILTVIYAVTAVGLSLFLLGDEGEAAWVDWIVWGAVFAATTFLFLIVTFRMSVAAPDSRSDKRR